MKKAYISKEEHGKERMKMFFAGLIIGLIIGMAWGLTLAILYKK